MPIVSPHRFMAGTYAALFAGSAVLSPVASNAQSPSGNNRNTPRSAPAALEIIGHRGAAGLEPENTLAAFRRACAIGVAGIELDVHLTRDSVLVVHHDYTLHPDIARDASGTWVSPQNRPAIQQLTHAQLQQYDVGRLRPGSDYAKRHPDQTARDGERIPTLDAVVSMFQADCPASTRLVVEIKTDPTNPHYSATPNALAEHTVALLKKRRVLTRAQIIAFDWRPLRRVRELDPSISTSHLTFEGKDWNTIEIGKAGPAAWMGDIDVDDHGGSVPRAIHAAGGKNWSPNSANVTPERVREAHALGLKVYVWTVNVEADMTRFIAMGVDGFTTDHPDILRRLLQK